MSRAVRAPAVERSRIGALERAAFVSWPAEEVAALGGWQVRAMGGVTRRANSVYTAEGATSGALDARIDAVESFYAARGLRTRFQMSPNSTPLELDARLEQRGYVVEAPVTVMIAEADCVASLEIPRAVVTVQRRLTEQWFDISGRSGRYRGVESTYRGLLERLSPSAVFALAGESEVPAAAGLAVVHGELCGIFSMLTLGTARRRGLGQAVLVMLARAGSAMGAKTLYLQVEQENAAALSLYSRAGFEGAYDYAYRAAP